VTESGSASQGQWLTPYHLHRKCCHLQGILLKRHKIPGPSGHQLAPNEVQVGQTVTVYGRTYYIAAVDAFTRHYLAEHGIQLAPDEQVPACPYDAWLAAHNAPGEHVPSNLLIKYLYMRCTYQQRRIGAIQVSV